METIPTMRIEGLEEAIASLGELSRAIEKVTESVRLASSALSQFLPSNISSGFSLSATLGGMEPMLGTDLTSAFPVSFLAETLPRVPEMEAPAGMLTAALTKLDQSTVTLRDAVDTLARTIPDLAMQPAQLIGVSPEQLQLQLGALQLNENSGSSFADVAAQTATGLGVALTTSGHPYIGVPVMAGGLAASWGLEESRTDSLFPYDEEAAEQMELIRSWGDISEVEDGLIFSRQGAADARARVFWDRFAFFAERLKELNELAMLNFLPWLMNPGNSIGENRRDLCVLCIRGTFSNSSIGTKSLLEMIRPKSMQAKSSTNSCASQSELILRPWTWPRNTLWVRRMKSGQV